MKLPLWIYLLFSLIFLFLGPIFLPHLRIAPFAPLIAIICYRFSFSQALWISFSLGFILDLFSSQFRFGVMALDHTLATFFLYSAKKHFFEDKAIAFSLYSALISAVLSLLLIFVNSKEIPITLSLLFSDLFVMPSIDGLYAFICFTCPTAFYISIKRHLLNRKLSSNEDS